MSETERDRIRYALNNETLGACDCNDCVSAIERLLTEARAEAWDEGHRVGWEHHQDGNYGNDWWDDDTPNPYRIARTAAQPATSTEEER